MDGSRSAGAGREPGGLRREGGEPGRRRARATRPGPGLLRQPRPRRDLHGARERVLRPRRPQGVAARALGPLGPNQGGGSRARRLGDQLRAGAAAGPRAGAGRGRRRRPGGRAADLAHLAARSGNREALGPARQDGGDRGHPLSGPVPGDDPGGGRALDLGRDPGRGRVQPAAGAAGGRGRRDPGRLPQHRGRRSGPSRRKPVGGPRERARRPQLRRARPRRPGRAAGGGPRGAAPVHRRPGEGHEGRGRRVRRPRPGPCSRPATAWTPS